MQRFREFQSGLVFRSGKQKPAYKVFPHPFVITGDRFWGQVRPGRRHAIKVQRSPRRGARFSTIATVDTNWRR